MTHSRKLSATLLVALAATSLNAPAGNEVIETRAFLQAPPCPTFVPPPRPRDAEVVPFLGAVLSAVAKPLVDRVVDAGVQAIQAAAADKPFPLPPIFPFTGKFFQLSPGGDSQINPEIQCLVVVTGQWSKGGDETPSSPPPDWVTTALTKVKGLTTDELKVPPALYFEAEFVIADGGKHFGLRPHAFYVSEFQSSSSWGRDKRKYELSLSYLDIQSGTAFATPKFVYENIAAPYAALSCQSKDSPKECRSNAAGPTQGWWPVHPETDALKAAIAGRKKLAGRLSLLTSPPEEVGLQILSVQEAMLANSKQLNPYCDALAADNAIRPRALYVSDDLCPVALALARSDTLGDAALHEARLAYVDSIITYQTTCGPDRDKSPSATEIETRRRTYFRNFAKNIPTSAAPLTKDAIRACLELGDVSPRKSLVEFQISGNIVETRYGSAIAKWFAPVAVAAAPEIKAALKQQLPEERRKADAARQVADAAAAAAGRSARQAVREADFKVSKAELDLSVARGEGDPAKILDAELALLKAKFEANAAYRAVGLPVPYPDFD